MRLFPPRLAPNKLLWSAALCFGLASAAHLTDAQADIIWSGDFESGDFMQWHLLDGSAPNFSQMPDYCRPSGYSNGGDGSCLSLENNIVRQGNFSAKFTIKNSENGSEPADCDNGTCTRRRVQLTGQTILPDVYDAMPYHSERWLSFSVYFPDDWSSAGSGWGPVLYGVKPRIEDGLSGLLNIEIENGSWVLWHRWDEARNPDSSQVPWQQQMFYSATYPKADGSDSGADLRADFPNQTQSQRALGSINKGGWTDWVIHVKFDARGSNSGGTGFMEVYKREDNNDWIKVLDIRPQVVTRGGHTFDRGIGYNSPPTNGSNGGFGLKAGPYMAKTQVWDLPNNRVMYLDNVLVGNQDESLASMTPGGSDQQVVAKPDPPTNLSVQ